MNTINFEGLGIRLNINSVLFEFKEIKIYWYAVCIVVGIAVALLFCKKDNGKYGIKFMDVLSLALILLPVSIIFARLYYVIFKLNYYSKNLIEIFNIRNGGLAIYGALIGAIVTIIFFCKYKKINILDMTDYLAPFVAIGQSIGRWGNFFNLEAHGTETTSLFRMGIVENGKYIQVYPTFFYESVCTLIIFFILYIKRNKRDYTGQITFIYFFLYGFIRAIIEGLRTDSLMIANFRVSQIISIFLCIIFGSILLYKDKKINKRSVISGIGIISFDQLIKHLIINKEIILIPNFLKFSYTENKGGAFGIGNKYVITCLCIFIIIGIIICLKKYKIKNTSPLILIISGGIGNTIDRIFRGFVIDYVDIVFWKFPCFNLADILIVFGSFLLAFEGMRKILKN